MKKPKEIYLQFEETYNTTWSEDKINDSDTKYIRADIVDKKVKEIEEEMIKMSEMIIEMGLKEVD